MPRVFIAPTINSHDGGNHISRARDAILRQARTQMTPDTYHWIILDSSRVQFYIEGESSTNLKRGYSQHRRNEPKT